MDRLPKLASELVSLKADVIVTSGPPGIRAAHRAIDSVPLSWRLTLTPWATASSLTWRAQAKRYWEWAALDPELSGKRVEFLKETIPKLSRVAVLGDSTIPGYTKVLKETEVAAASYKVQLQY